MSKKDIKILRKEEVYYAKHTLVSSRNKKTYKNDYEQML